ncbi:DMT family transporter [Thauera sinica]|uniref:DMT family transporter n=1 Tax=Thauera sinica TaxID=2665146 RepID=A0ABW1ALN4_9RHOO|nr:DMT family transporter [Thauera sp. K11]ATE60731.1 EamA family transporter [Thauera sp. K11]
MISGLLCALGAGLLWGLVFVTPLVLDDYPGLMLSIGRYAAFGVLALGLAWFDRHTLARLGRADWIEAFKLAAIGNLLYYTTLSTAIQLAGAPLPTLIIGTLPVVIAVCANLVDRRTAAGGVPWRRLALPLAAMLGGLLLVHADTTGRAGADDPDGAGYLLGIASAACALACWTWYPIRNGRWLRARDAGLSRAWATAQGLATLPLALLAALGYALWDGVTAAPGAGFGWPFGPRPALFVGMMLALGLAASWLGTLLWNHASARLPAALVGQLIVFETLSALLYAFVWHQRWPGPAEMAGIVLLTIGVLLGVRVFGRA